MRTTARVVAALFSGAIALAAPAGADPALPPMTSTGAGPVIGGGGPAAQIGQQLYSFNNPDIQEVNGSDAAQFIAAAAGVSNRDVASVFQPLHRALGCQQNNAGFGARAYRRSDGQWGGGMLVIAKSTVSDVEALKACVKGSWRRAVAGSPTTPCNSGWNYPPFSDTRRGAEGYFVLLSGTNSDFCNGPNANFRTNASGWPT